MKAKNLSWFTFFLIVATFFSCENAEKIAYAERLVATIDKVDQWRDQAESLSSDTIKSGIDFNEFENMKVNLESSLKHLDKEKHNSEYYLSLSDSLDRRVSEFQDSVILTPFHHWVSTWKYVVENSRKKVEELKSKRKQPGVNIYDLAKKAGTLRSIETIVAAVVKGVEADMQLFKENKHSLMQLGENFKIAELQLQKFAEVLQSNAIMPKDS